MIQRTWPARQAATSLLAFLLLIFSLLPQQALALQRTEVSTIELTGTLTESFELDASDVQLFSLKNMAPGDSWSGRVNVVNKTNTQMSIQLLSIVSNLEDLMLYDALHLIIIVDGDLVYNGSYGATGEPITTELTVPNDKPLSFDIYVSLPETVGNEMQSKEMDSTWTFEAHCDDPTNIQTGVDLTVGNSGNAIWLIIAGLCLICGVVLFFRVKSVKKARQQFAEKEATTSHDE